jgi:hypothetical protein
MGRTGTTLLGRILAAHPDVGFLNEPKAMWHVIRDDEDIIGSYSRLRNGRLYLGPSDADGSVVERAHALFAWYLWLSRSKRVVDKYPELVFRDAFVRAVFPDALFLVAIRSPWTTLRSVSNWSASHAADGANWWGVRDQKWHTLWTQGVLERPENADIGTLELASANDERIRAGIEWLLSMRAALSLVESDPSSYPVRYETLVRQPREQISAILSFCGLAECPRTEAYAASTVTVTEQNDDDRNRLLSILPAGLISAIDETWARLEACGRMS